MWPTFLFGCLFEALSAALVATAWLRMRKAEQALAQKLQENSELQGQLAGRKAQAKEQQTALEGARLELAARSRELGAFSERCAQLEKAAALRTNLEQQHQLMASQLKETWSARTKELESRLAARELELQERAATIESLQREVAASELRTQTQAERSTELELELERLAERIRAHQAVDPAQHEALSARIAELEALLASREQQLESGAAAIDGFMAQGAASELQIEVLGRRCSELEAELQRATGADRTRSQDDQELQSALSARAADLEAKLANREQDLEQREAAIGSLQAEVSMKAAQLAALGLRCSELEADLQRAMEQARERLQHEQEVSGQLSARSADLEATLESREQDLRQRETVLGLLQGEVGAKQAQVETLSRRCSELELEVQRAIDQAAQRLRQEQELCGALSARAGELEQHIASRDRELHEHAASIERLQGEIAERQGQVEALGARCGELEAQLQQANREHQRLLRQEQVTSSALSAVVVELENQLAERAQEPREDAALIEHLQAEVRDKHVERESLEQRLCELEQELQAQREQALELRRLDDELQCALSARASELEARVASSVEDLHREIASARALENAVDATALQLEAARQRNAELEQQVRRRAQQQADQEVASLAHADQLEAELASRNEQILELRNACEQLTQRCNSVSEQVEQRMRELEQRDRQLANCSASLEALNFAVQACHDEIHADAALIDELAGMRIAAVFQRGNTKRSRSLPSLYLDGLGQGDLCLALAGMFGDEQPLSASAFERLVDRWRDARETAKQSPLAREVAYLWTAGIHLETGIERDSDTLLVVVAACVDGSRSVLAVETGERESKDRWLAILNELARREMNLPRIVVGDARLGVWPAMDELGWTCSRQHCWNAMRATVLTALPKPRRAQASKMLQAIAEASSRTSAKQLRERFVKRCGVRLASVGELVSADWKQLTSLYAFPKEHWSALRTADAIEAPLVALRLRAAKPKASKLAPNVEAILWKLLSCAVEAWPPLDALELVPSLLRTERRAPDPACIEVEERGD